MDKNSHEFSLEVLKSVDQFYSESFAHLFTYISWAGFALIAMGAAVPVILQFLQKRFFKIESEAIKNELKKEHDEMLIKELKEISDLYREEKEKLELEIDKKIAQSIGISFMMQSSTAPSKEATFILLTQAVLQFLNAECDILLSQVLQTLKELLPKLEDNYLAKHKNIFENIIIRLNEHDKKRNGAYSATISILKEELEKSTKDKK